MVLSEGKDASPLVALAEAVAVKTQDVKEFELLLNCALMINPDANPDTRLLNLVMQRRACCLLSRKTELFLLENESEVPNGKPQHGQIAARGPFVCRNPLE